MLTKNKMYIPLKLSEKAFVFNGNTVGLQANFTQICRVQILNF